MNHHLLQDDSRFKFEMKLKRWLMPSVVVLVGLTLLTMLFLPRISVYLFPEREIVEFNESYFYLTDQEWELAVNHSLSILASLESERLRWVNEETESLTEDLFNDARQNVGSVGDWYFSFWGNIERVSLDRAKLEHMAIEKLFEVDLEEKSQLNVLGEVMSKSDHWARENFESARDVLLSQLEPFEINEGQVSRVDRLVELAWDPEALMEQTIHEETLAERLAAGAITSAAIGGTITLLTSRAVSNRAAAMGSRGFTRLLPTICLATGPLALACGAGTSVATMVATEVTFMHLDESIGRQLTCPVERHLSWPVDAESFCVGL